MERYARTKSVSVSVANWVKLSKPVGSDSSCHPFVFRNKGALFLLL